MKYIILAMSLTSCTQDYSVMGDFEGELKNQYIISDYDESNFSKYGIDNKNGFVRSSRVAFEIAEAVAKEIYGNSQIEKQKPFYISLNSNIWYVRGSASDSGSHLKGGTFEIEISKLDGKIIRVSHGK